MPTVSVDRVREALLALEGEVISDLVLPLPGYLLDISKAAALVGGVVEDRIPAMLNRARDRTWDEEGELHAFEFRRVTIGFPDIHLVERANPTNVLFQLEAKSWYILAADSLTARFQTATSAMKDGTLIAIVAWLLDGVVSGSPKLLRIHSDDAQRLAAVRDAEWVGIDPGTHRVVQPSNPPGTSLSAITTNVLAESFSKGEWHAESQNFGKLDRLHDDQIRAFRDDVWTLTAAGKTLGEWRRFFKS
jgi:hypothetical protein